MITFSNISPSRPWWFGTRKVVPAYCWNQWNILQGYPSIQSQESCHSSRGYQWVCPCERNPASSSSIGQHLLDVKASVSGPRQQSLRHKTSKWKSASASLSFFLSRKRIHKSSKCVVCVLCLKLFPTCFITLFGIDPMRAIFRLRSEDVNCVLTLSMLQGSTGDRPMLKGATDKAQLLAFPYPYSTRSCPNPARVCWSQSWFRTKKSLLMLGSRFW